MEKSANIHVLVFPWLALGHIIPFLELSKSLAKRGHRVTFVTTPRNIERLPKFPIELAPNINLVKITLPQIDGLPENAETTIDISPDKAVDGLEEPMSAILEIAAPDWIIHDFGHFWVPKLARKFGIRCCFFSVFSATARVIMGGPTSALLAKDAWQVPDRLTSSRPWVPFSTGVVYRHHEALLLSQNSGPNVSGITDPNRIGLTIEGCDIISLRCCKEFEAEWLDLAEEIYQKPILPMGTMPPGESIEEEEHVLMKWLDQQAQNSTVYVAFGSELTPNREQMHEIAHGLELSQLPFIWALRGEPGEPNLLPEGFEERTKDHGLVHMDWVPQNMILSHPSIEGFFSHGGWGSFNEGLAFGKLLIVFPVMLDQPLNARIVEQKKIGVAMMRNERDGSFDRVAVAKALKLVMVEDEGEQLRANAKATKEIFGDYQLQDCYMDNFVDYLKRHKRQSGPLMPRATPNDQSMRT